VQQYLNLNELMTSSANTTTTSGSSGSSTADVSSPVNINQSSTQL